MYFSRREPPQPAIHMLKANSGQISVECFDDVDGHEYKYPRMSLYWVSYGGFDMCRITGGKYLGYLDCATDVFTSQLDFKEGETQYVVGE